MSWKCPECGKNLKRKGNHPETHNSEPGDVDYNAIEAVLANGPALGGEVGRLRTLQAHDADSGRDWASVYDGYVKLQKNGDGTRNRRDRDELRKATAAQRQQGQW